MRFDDGTRAKMRANKRNWDARAPIHADSAFYGIGDRDPSSWFAPFEWRDLGRLDGCHVLHLQCHLGTETMAFALKGAHTTGLDVSDVSVQQAQRIAREADLTIEYVQADVYDAVEVLGA
ncbi:methyltransferase domain-containing protein [Mycobacterium sp. NPDC003449]